MLLPFANIKLKLSHNRDSPKFVISVWSSIQAGAFPLKTFILCNKFVTGYAKTLAGWAERTSVTLHCFFQYYLTQASERLHKLSDQYLLVDKTNHPHLLRRIPEDFF